MAVQVVAAPGARVVATQVGPLVSGPAGAAWVSVTPTPVRVTLPVLATWNV